MHASTLQVVEGGWAEFRCVPEPRTDHLVIEWQRNGKPLGVERASIGEGGTLLRLENLLPRDSGKINLVQRNIYHLGKKNLESSEGGG